MATHRSRDPDFNTRIMPGTLKGANDRAQSCRGKGGAEDSATGQTYLQVAGPASEYPPPSTARDGCPGGREAIEPIAVEVPRDDYRCVTAELSAWRQTRSPAAQKAGVNSPRSVMDSQHHVSSPTMAVCLPGSSPTEREAVWLPEAVLRPVGSPSPGSRDKGYQGPGVSGYR